MLKRILAVAVAVGAVVTAVIAAPAIGEKGTNFELTGIDEKTYTLEQYAGESDAIVLLWISKNCPISLAYDDYYNRFFAQFEGKDVTILAINSNKDEPVDQIKAHAEAKGFKFVVLKDNGSEVADAYEATRTPEVRIFDTNLVLKYSGAITNNQNPARATVHHASNAVNSVLAGQNPDPAQVDAFGCTIKR